VPSVPRCCKQGGVELVQSVSQSRVAVAEARGQFGSPEEVERPLLEAVTIGLVKTQQAEKT
jgi:hypothetical protein